MQYIAGNPRRDLNGNPLTENDNEKLRENFKKKGFKVFHTEIAYSDKVHRSNE